MGILESWNGTAATTENWNTIPTFHHSISFHSLLITETKSSRYFP
jgi:hypothetical protein